jgi:hypothetical protein
MKIKWSGFGAVDGRGKINGHVASKNRSGAYARTKVSPVNPQTTFQLVARAFLTALSQAWRALTQSQMLAWNGAVNSFAKTDVFGDLRQPTGKNLYTQLNINLSNAAQATISDPPLPSGAGGVIAGVAIATEAGVKSIAHTTDTAGHTILVFATPGVSPGKFFLKNDYRLIGRFTGGAASPFVATTVYDARFGDVVAGQRVGFRLQSVNNLTGESSTISESTTIAV